MLDRLCERDEGTRLDNVTLLIDTRRFPKVWHPEGGDSNPPPGREFAQALLEGFRSRSVLTIEESVEEDMWEHGYWCFRVVHEGWRYWIRLEPVGDELMLHGWCVHVESTARSLVQLVFRPRAAGTALAAFRELTEQLVRTVADPFSARWVSDEKYLREVAGFGGRHQW